METIVEIIERSERVCAGSWFLVRGSDVGVPLRRGILRRYPNSKSKPSQIEKIRLKIQVCYHLLLEFTIKIKIEIKYVINNFRTSPIENRRYEIKVFVQ